MMSEIGSEELINDETGEKRRSPSFNPIYIMADSGARGRLSRSASWPACAA